MKKRHVLWVSTLMLAGCGVGNPPPMTPYPPQSTSPATSAPATPSESPMSNPPTPTFPSGKGASGETTVVGVVEQGVERGCMILRAGDQMYQLVGSADPRIKPGATLSVRGKLNPNLVTTCQQGTPLQVVAIQPA